MPNGVLLHERLVQREVFAVDECDAVVSGDGHAFVNVLEAEKRVDGVGSLGEQERPFLVRCREVARFKLLIGSKYVTAGYHEREYFRSLSIIGK